MEALSARRFLTPAAAQQWAHPLFCSAGKGTEMQREGKEGKKAKPGRTWQSQRREAALTVDQLFHLVVPGPQVGLGVGSLGRERLAARSVAGLGAAPGSAGGRRVVVSGLPVAAVPGALAGFGTAALAGDGHGEEPGGRASPPPQCRHAQRRHGTAGRRSPGAARARPGLAPLRSTRPGRRRHTPGGQSPPPGARGPGQAGPGRATPRRAGRRPGEAALGEGR